MPYLNVKNVNLPSTDTMYNHGQRNDDDYLSLISQYKGKTWYERLLDNPYLYSKQAKFSPNLFQSILGFFGDTSSEDRYYADLQSRQSEWLSDMVQQMEQQDYNSESAQYERQRSVGLNPDLNGVNAGVAAENDQPILGAASMGDDSSSAIQQVAQTGMGFLTGIMNLAQSFYNVKSVGLSNVHQELANNDAALDFVVKQIAGSSTFSLDDLNSMSDDDLGGILIDNASKIDYSGYSPSTRKLIKSMFGRMSAKMNGKNNLLVSGLRSKLRAELAENQSRAVKAASSPLFSEDFNEFLRKYSEILGKAEYDLQYSQLKSNKAKSDYDTRYFHAANPEKRAESENAEYGANEVTAQQTETIESMWNDVYKLCKDTHEWYGTLGLILIPFLRSTISNMSVGFGRLKSGKFGFTGLNL